MRAYKVIEKRRDKLRSCIVIGKNAAVTYIPKKAVYAPEWLAKKGYHLCVFRKLDNAKRFAGRRSHKIWLANIRGIILHLPRPLDTSFLTTKNIVGAGGSWPVGTIMAKSVTLIKEVKIK